MLPNRVDRAGSSPQGLHRRGAGEYDESIHVADDRGVRGAFGDRFSELGSTNARSLSQWFSRSGYFAHVARETNIARDKPIETLVRASRHLLAGRWPCLMIGANVLTGEPRGRAFPDHWVVLASEVRIDGSSAAALFTKGIGASDPQLGKKTISFSVLSWGELMPLKSSVTVDGFLDFFYGYVTAQ